MISLEGHHSICLAKDFNKKYEKIGEIPYEILKVANEMREIYSEYERVNQEMKEIKNRIDKIYNYISS
jgi:uncharacterized coiled-coil DUF342 family protein